MKRILLILGAIVLTFNISSAQNYISNRAPLLESNYMELPIGDIKAEGWLLLQLQAQRTGLTGNLDEVYPNAEVSMISVNNYEYLFDKCMAKAGYRLAALLNDIFK